MGPFNVGFFLYFWYKCYVYFNIIIRYFFFINGSFWSIFNINKTNEDLYKHVFSINSSDKIVSFLKIISLPFNFVVFFYKNIIFSLFFKRSKSFFNSIPFITSTLLINYKKNLFKSLTNYSISNNFTVMYNYINLKQLDTGSLISTLPYSFYSIKATENSQLNNYFFYFFFKKLIANLYNVILIQVYNFGLNTVLSTFSPSDLKKSLRFFPFFLAIFFFILVVNTIGIVPYSSTLTSYVSVTLILTLIIIVGAYYTVFTLHGIEFFSLFMPQGCPFGLIFIIIPIEFVSYVFRLVSLSARLFANMMAGHALLAVLASFSWTMFNSASSSIVLLGTIPLLVVSLLFFLETGVAIVQAVVFTILSCMYLDQAVN